MDAQSVRDHVRYAIVAHAGERPLRFAYYGVNVPGRIMSEMTADDWSKAAPLGESVTGRKPLKFLGLMWHPAFDLLGPNTVVFSADPIAIHKLESA